MRLDVQFNPFTYEELIRPIADYNEAYNALADSYATLSDQTEAFRNEVNATDSPIAYEQFNKYSDNLGAAVDDFSRGMTSSNRANLLNMKRRYSREIGTIAKAAEARRAANDLRDKAGPDAIFEVSSYNSLDPFLEGKTVNNRYQSASNITATTAAMAEAIMAEVAKDPDLLNAIEGYKLMVQHSGGSYDDLKAAITNTVIADPNTLNKFNEIKNRVKKDLGYTNYDAQGQAAIERAINTGLFAGLDKPVKTLIEDKTFITPALKENRRQFNAEMNSKGFNSDGSINYDSPVWVLKGYTKKDGTLIAPTEPTETITPTYDKIQAYYYDEGLSQGLPEGRSITGMDVSITSDGTQFSITAGGKELAKIKGTDKGYQTEFTTLNSDTEFEYPTGEKVKWDPGYDAANAKKLINSIIKILDREGEEGLNNYDFYLELDDASGSNFSGGYFINPLKKQKVSIREDNNVDPNLGGQ